MIRFPCALCNRQLPALATEGEYSCPCGASYQLRAMVVEGVSGLAILLGRDAAAAALTAACGTCGVEIGVGHIPPVALFLVPGHGLLPVDQVGQRCPACGSQVPVEVDPEAAPCWRGFAGSAQGGL